MIIMKSIRAPKENNLRTESLLLLRNGQAPPPVTNWNRQHPKEVFGLNLEIHQIHFEKIIQKILPSVPCFLNADFTKCAFKCVLDQVVFPNF